MADGNEEHQCRSDSSSNQDTAPPTFTSGHSNTVSTSDDLESFFRQLSHVSCKSDPDEVGVDILTELDEAISRLDASSEDFDTEKTIAGEDDPPTGSASEESFHPQTVNVEAANENTEPGLASANGERTNIENGMDGTVEMTANGEKMLASEADKDEDKADDGDGVECSKAGPLSSLLHCKYDPPYLPTIGTFV